MILSLLIRFGIYYLMNNKISKIIKDVHESGLDDWKCDVVYAAGIYLIQGGIELLIVIILCILGKSVVVYIKEYEN